jgi:hypothetical protein
VSGIRFASERDFRSCQVCRRPRCSHREAPFDPDLWRELNETDADDGAGRDR